MDGRGGTDSHETSLHFKAEITEARYAWRNLRRKSQLRLQQMQEAFTTMSLSPRTYF
jgi:hypothetical protein